MFEHLISRDGEKSSTKTLTLLCWLFTTAWYCVILYKGNMSAEYIGVYLGAFVLNQAVSTSASYYAKTKGYTPTSSRCTQVDDPDRR